MWSGWRTPRDAESSLQIGSIESCVSIPLSPPVPDASPAAACASQCLPAKAYRNIPLGESDESLAEVIQVLDPRHPLYGRSFRVIRRSTHRGGNFAPSYEVEHRSGTSLLVPISVTEPYEVNANLTKLCIDALRDLISQAECLECHERRSEGTLGVAAAGSAPPDRRRRRRNPGGGLP